jgi:type II secretory pathway component GspD/PulD (secretin)
MILVHVFLFSQAGFSQTGFSQTLDNQIISLDFRNQKISDILLSLAEISHKTIILDESISGNATFRFADSNFENALMRFADYSNLFVTKQENVYYVSKILIHISQDDKNISLETEDVMPELIIKKLAQETHTTIVYDTLPSERITIRTQNSPLEEILRLILIKNPEYTIISQSGGYYLKRDTALLNESRAVGTVRITEQDGLYSVSSQRVVFNTLIDNLFKEAEKEYLILNRNTAAIENIFYEEKDFASILRLILDTVNYDYTIENGVYYLFEIQERDVIKKLKETVSVKFNHLSVIDVQNILPSELNAANFIRVDRITNSIFVTGSTEEITPILSFFRSIDIPLEGRYYTLFSVSNIDVSDSLLLLPKTFFYTEPVIIPNTNSFTAQVDAASEIKINEYINIIDRKNPSYPIKLRYIKSDELLKFLPPAVTKENLTITGDSSLVFYTGTEDAYNNVMKDITIIDQPKAQIRYQLLVIQRQRSDNVHWGTDFSIIRTDSSPSADYSAQLSNLVNINFDIVSTFGLQFAGNLNAELGMNRAKVLADTTLNAISEEEITFENTTTYRYRDVAIDTETGLYSGATREITSGLRLNITGWVSGDEMITVNVDANVSKQGAVSSNNDAASAPPSTSEKSVNTHVRTKSGEPIIIGGLLQSESDVIEKRVPFLGDIPLLGLLFRSEQITVTETEFIIYLIPFVEKVPSSMIDIEKNIRSYYQTYVKGD